MFKLTAIKPNKRRGQILVSTLILLMLVAMTVVIITATVAKNSRQVFNNLEYEKSYNYAETRLLEVIPPLSDPDLDLTLLQSSTNPVGTTCEEILAGTKYYCGWDEIDNRRTLVTIEETNVVESYDLGAEEYFDIILFSASADQGYQGSVSIEWVGSTALDLNLIYLTSGNELRNKHEVVDNASVYNSSTGKDFITNVKLVPSGNSLEVNLGNAQVPGGSKLRYLRVRAVNKQIGTAITIKPIQGANLPKQVRRLEAFSYLKDEVESAAPVVFSQVPLSPPVPEPLVNSASFASIRQPICGNGIVEGSESCDDGNVNDSDECANDCQDPTCKIVYAADLPGVNTAPLPNNSARITIEQETEKFTSTLAAPTYNEFINSPINPQADVVLSYAYQNVGPNGGFPGGIYFDKVMEYAQNGTDVVVYGDDLFSNIYAFLRSYLGYDIGVSASRGDPPTPYITAELQPGTPQEYIDAINNVPVLLGGSKANVKTGDTFAVWQDTSFLQLVPTKYPGGKYANSITDFKCVGYTIDTSPPWYEGCTFGIFKHTSGADIIVVGGIGSISLYPHIVPGIACSLAKQ